MRNDLKVGETANFVVKTAYDSKKLAKVVDERKAKNNAYQIVLKRIYHSKKSGRKNCSSFTVMTE